MKDATSVALSGAESSVTAPRYSAQPRSRLPAPPPGRSRELPNWLSANLSRGYGLAVLLALIGAVAVPIGFVIYGSTQSGTPFSPESRLTGEWLRSAFASGSYLESLFGTAAFSLAVGLVAVVIATVLAWILNRLALPGGRILEALVVLPLFMSPFLMAIAWLMLGAPRSGIVNSTAASLFGDGTEIIDVTSTVAIVLIMAVAFVPYAYLIVSPALRNIDPSQEEAASLNGAGPFRTAIMVTLPSVRPAILAALLLISVVTTGIFSIPDALGARSAFRPVAVRIYDLTADNPTNFPLAAALGCSLLVIVLIILYLYRRAVRSSKRFVTVGARGYRRHHIDIGRWKPVALGLCYLYVLLAIVIPYAALTLMSLSPYTSTDLTNLKLSLDNYRKIISSEEVRSALNVTLIVGVLSATLCMLLAASVAYIVERSRLRGRQILYYVAIATVAVPGLVLGVGMVWAYVRTPLYGTSSLLILGFVASSLPFGTMICLSGLIQVDRSLEESAAVCGASRIRRAVLITLPLAKSSLVAGWIFVFIVSVRELSLPVVLYSPGNAVLSVLTWNYSQSGNTPLAAAVGMIQTGVLLIAVIIGSVGFRLRLSKLSGKDS